METAKKSGHVEVDVQVDILSNGHTELVDIEAEGPVDIIIKKDEVDVITEGDDGERTVIEVHPDSHGTKHEHGGQHPHHDHGHGEHHQPEPPPLVERISVNENDVRVHAIELTGLQIKEAAIAQHVKIELNFVLAEEFPDDTRRIIGNSDVVRLHEGMKFSAVRDDDNS